MRTFRFIRLWILPILSLIATYFLPLNSYALWFIWAVTFVGVCDGGSHAMGVVRPAFWVGIHIFLIVLH